jgi:ribosomal protein S27AE
MRAHANPTRMKNIKKATEDLISKLHKFCPNCGAPGFIVSERVKGLPCELCGLPSDIVLKALANATNATILKSNYILMVRLLRLNIVIFAIHN